MPVPLVIIDDSILLRQRLRTLLSRLGVVDIVGEATTAEEALRICRERRPGIVTVDIALPDRSGLELISELQRLDPRPFIVVLTNFPYLRLRVEAGELGVDAFLSKSDPPRAIAEAIESQARRRAGEIGTTT